MNSRFQFRAWSFVNKEMKTPKEVSLFNDEGETVSYSHYDEYDTDEDALMQSTGLSDKNGKLIYEGDIVKTNYIPGEGDDVVNFPVTWGINSGQWLAGEHYLGYYLRKNDVFEVEVIGNIYENPELLTK